ncbi:MAG: mechanosensitive ion channel protein MscS [Bacteroidetes bacterium QH_2_63_10]|nr:MAG: mechanosensitive ion channel protein MscS [Bacteroidetes bacterium QH_2_63_10]
MNGVSPQNIVVSLATVAVGILGGYLLYYLFQWLSRKADRGRYQIDGILLRIFGPPVSVLVALVSVNYALYRIPKIREQFDQWEGAQRALFILTGTWILASLVKNFIREYGLPFAERTDTDLDERIIRLMDLTAVYVIWLMGILVSLRELGIQVTAFLASMGIAGLAVALAAKTVLSNVLAGVTLTADPNFRVGDRIEVGEYIGDVLSINLHKTVIRTRDNEIVMIPNDVLGREVIVNHMLPEQRTRTELEIGVAYGTDLKRATELLSAVIQESNRILSEPTPEVNVASLGDNAILLQVLVWIDAPREKRRVRDGVYRRALARFEEAGIEIPFPQRVVQITDGTPSSEKS